MQGLTHLKHESLPIAQKLETQIGFEWVQDSYCPPGDANCGHCQQQCSAASPSGCHSQRTCEGSGNQWVVGVAHGGGGGIIVAPGFNPTGGRGRRAMQALPPTGPTVAQCELPCSLTNIYLCKTSSACTGVGGNWQASGTSGYCHQPCSLAHTYECHDMLSCVGVGAQWVQAGSTSTFHCNAPTTTTCDIQLFLDACSSSVTGSGSASICDTTCGNFLTHNYDSCSSTPPSGMSAAQWQANFGPIVTMCQTYNADPELHQCVGQMQEATSTLNRVCCHGHDCENNHGAPSRCTGQCANIFLPYFESCGALLLTSHETATALGRFYRTCTASHHSQDTQDPRLCRANNGHSLWTAIEFRSGCQLWIKYIDAQTHQEIPDFMLLNAVAGVAVPEFLDNARTVCGKLDMVRRLAVDFSGILAISGVPEHNTMTLTVNHPASGNVDVQATNNAANTRQVQKQWRAAYSTQDFNPDNCPAPQTPSVGPGGPR
jgi:hypothetical protein